MEIEDDKSESSDMSYNNNDHQEDKILVALNQSNGLCSLFGVEMDNN